MAVIAVVNRKGGSGKSTLATHLAAWLARDGERVLLGDVDRQLSTQVWLKQRASTTRGQVTGWTVDPRAMVRPPANTGHVVLDTPGGLRGFDLARVVMYADVILMPVCHSAFDRAAAAEGFAELQALPRVAQGRCRIAAVGMRVDSRADARESLKRWASDTGVELVGALRYSPRYVQAIDDGLTLFDLPAATVKTDLAQWQPILEWVAQSLGSKQPEAVVPKRPTTLGGVLRATLGMSAGAAASTSYGAAHAAATVASTVASSVTSSAAASAASSSSFARPPMSGPVRAGAGTASRAIVSASMSAAMDALTDAATGAATATTASASGTPASASLAATVRAASRPNVMPSIRRTPEREAGAPVTTQVSQLLGRLSIPQFLQRDRV